MSFSSAVIVLKCRCSITKYPFYPNQISIFPPSSDTWCKPRPPGAVFWEVGAGSQGGRLWGSCGTAAALRPPYTRSSVRRAPALPVGQTYSQMVQDVRLLVLLSHLPFKYHSNDTSKQHPLFWGGGAFDCRSTVKYWMIDWFSETLNISLITSSPNSSSHRPPSLRLSVKWLLE